MNRLLYFIKNGFYIPLIPFITCNFMDFYVSSMICIQLCSLNYFFWFSNHFNYNIPKKYNIFKQFINFTYSGNYAMYIAYVFPELFLPICHNLQFVITFSYWVGKTFYKCEDTDEIYHPDVSNKFVKVWSALGHIIPYSLCLAQMTEIECIFNFQTMMYTFLWTYAWLILIYIPWRCLTKDPVYTILKSFTFKKLVEYLITIHLIIFSSNYIGYFINDNIKKYLN